MGAALGGMGGKDHPVENREEAALRKEAAWKWNLSLRYEEEEGGAASEPWSSSLGVLSLAAAPGEG